MKTSKLQKRKMEGSTAFINNKYGFILDFYADAAAIIQRLPSHFIEIFIGIFRLKYERISMMNYIASCG